MGRQVRMVPKDWEHPKDARGKYIPLHDNYEEAVAEFQEYEKEHGWAEAVDWFGRVPSSRSHMIPEGERNYYMMYEDTTEGTPISPAFATPEELAHWLADTGASSFAGMTASYESWLATIRRGSAMSMVFDAEHGLRSGVEFAGEEEQEENANAY
jgi:hypothetical protein